MNTELDLEHETPHFGKQMLAAAADGLRKFVWVGCIFSLSLSISCEQT